MAEREVGGDWLADYLEWKMRQLETEPWTPPDVGQSGRPEEVRP
ncbi:hypothetical protein [Streptomyces sp. NPDC029526]